MRYFLIFVCKSVSFKSALKFQDLSVIRKRKKSDIYVDLSFTNKFFIKIAFFFLNIMLRIKNCALCIFCLRNNSFRRLNVSS